MEERFAMEKTSPSSDMLAGQWRGWRHLIGKFCGIRDQETPMGMPLVGDGVISRLLLICSSPGGTFRTWCYLLHTSCQGL